MFTVGDTVGDYEIVARLRSGGMAVLFLGRRAGAAGFAKHVAIKVVHEHLAHDPSFVQMFVDEALLSARIQHPNVVHVEELREIDGRHFLVMEYVYGGALAQLLQALLNRQRRLTTELAVLIAIKVADGLHAAHEVTDETGEGLAVVHRDVTPQNVLLSYSGHVKLIDFGVAKAKGRAETEAGSIKGKFRYLAPEQAFAKPVDRRTDIYALGIVLWEMLTMRQRFDASSDGGVLNRVRYPDPIPPSKHAANVSPELDAVVLKAMAPEAEDRYQTALELRDALVAVMPRAASLHESVLGQLLGLVLRDELEEEQKNLPESVSGMLAAPIEGSANAVLETLTISLDDESLRPLADDSTNPSRLPEAPTQLLDVSSEMGALSRGSLDGDSAEQVLDSDALIEAGGFDERPTEPPLAPVRRGPPPALLLALVAVVGAGLALLLGIVVVFAVTGEPEPMTTTTLPTVPTVTAPAVDAGPVVPEAPDAGPPVVTPPVVPPTPPRQELHPAATGPTTRPTTTRPTTTRPTTTRPTTTRPGSRRRGRRGGRPLATEF